MNAGLSPGVVMDLSIRWHDGGTTTSREEVVAFEAPRADVDGVKQATWVYRYRSWMSTVGMIRSVRTQTLSQAPGEPTVYESRIHLTGWGAGGAPLPKIRRGMEDQGTALKATAEAPAA